MPKNVHRPDADGWVTLLTCEGYNPLSGKYLFKADHATVWHRQVGGTLRCGAHSFIRCPIR